MHDGYRFICRRDADRVRVFSRRGHDWTDRVPVIAEALAALRVKSVTLDGEGVVCSPNGVADFDRLRAAVGRLGSRDAFLYAFDLLEINGDDLRPYEWQVRRATLASLLKRVGKGIRLSDHLDAADGETVFQHACAMGLEGIVAKRRDRPYRSGRSRRLTPAVVAYRGLSGGMDEAARVHRGSRRLGDVANGGGGGAGAATGARAGASSSSACGETSFNPQRD